MILGTSALVGEGCSATGAKWGGPVWGLLAFEFRSVAHAQPMRLRSQLDMGEVLKIASCRNYCGPGSRFNSFGFRVVLRGGESGSPGGF